MSGIGVGLAYGVVGGVVLNRALDEAKPIIADARKRLSAAAPVGSPPLTVLLDDLQTTSAIKTVGAGVGVGSLTLVRGAHRLPSDMGGVLSEA
jgi:hypothetical protein